MRNHSFSSSEAAIHLASAMDRDLGHLFSKCACVNSIYFVPVCTSTYNMEHNMASVIALNLEMGVSARTHVRLSRKLLHIYKYCY